MARRDSGGREGFEREVAVGHGVDGIGRRAVEAQRLRGHPTVDGKGRSGKRRSAQGTLVQPGAGVTEPPAVAPRHLHISHQVVTEGDGCAGCRWVNPGMAVAACSSARASSAAW